MNPISLATTYILMFLSRFSSIINLLFSRMCFPRGSATQQGYTIFTTSISKTHSVSLTVRIPYSACLVNKYLFLLNIDFFLYLRYLYAMRGNYDSRTKQF